MRSPLVALVVLASPLPAQEPTGGAKVYKQAIPSVVWVHSRRENGLATGSGSLVDVDRRLILTNYHVVGDNPRATVFFPEFRDGRPIPEKQYYLDRAGRLARRGKVVALDKKADLALVQLDTLPDGAKAIPLGPNSPDQGETVHAIGNAGRLGALWGYVSGTVRQVHQKRWKARLDKDRVAEFEARVVETNSATNPGDSGGPLLNDRGELVGVTQGGATDAQLVSTFVDVSEVRRLLNRDEVRRLKPDRPAPVAKRTTPLPVADNAKLFSADAVRAAEQAVADLYKENLDVLIQTEPAAPSAWREKAKLAKPDERQRLYKEWADERQRAEQAHGVAIIITLEPRFVAVDVDDAVKGNFPEGYAQTIADAVRERLREKKHDEALAEAVRLIREGYTGGKK